MSKNEKAVNIINIQPTTDYVKMGGPLINPSEYVTKNDMNEKLDNYATVKQATDISKNITESALENNYYTVTEIDGKLDCKSNTDHTHTSFNRLTVYNNRFDLLSNNKYVYLNIGHKNANYQAIQFGFGDDYQGQYGYLRVLGGTQLTVFIDKMTFPGELTVNTLNGIVPSNISLNTHNHDETYSKLEHKHTTSDITDVNTLSKADHTHTTINNDLEVKDNLKCETINGMNISAINGEFIRYPAIPTVGWYPFKITSILDFHLTTNSTYDWRICALNDNNLIFYNKSGEMFRITSGGNIICTKLNDVEISKYSLNTHNHDDAYSKLDHNHDWEYASIIHNHLMEYSAIDHRHDDVHASINHKHDGVYAKVDHIHNFDVTRFNFAVAESFLIYRAYDFGSFDNIKRCWRFMTANNGSKEYLRLYFQDLYLCYFENCDDKVNQLNRTITHNAPLEETLDKYEIGKPVFMSGNVYKLNEGEYVEETDNTDCIPSVKTEGTYKEYLGICVKKHKSGESVTVGDIVKKDITINQDTIDFATHGDFYFKVSDSWPYEVGDTLLYNGDILNDETPMTNKIQRMIIGVVTAIIDPNTVAIFKA